jgi:hypothetical protein
MRFLLAVAAFPNGSGQQSRRSPSWIEAPTEGIKGSDPLILVPAEFSGLTHESRHFVSSFFNDSDPLIRR